MTPDAAGQKHRKLIVVRCLACLLVFLLAACASERSSPECKEVCQKQARCVDQKVEAAALNAAGSPAGGAPERAEQTKFDQSECVAACTALRRDVEGEKIVQKHVACVNGAAGECGAILACP